MSVTQIRPTNETPLANLEAELSLIGALLYENKLAEQLCHVRADDFYETFHGKVWETAHEIIHRGDSADPVSVTEALGASRDELRMLADLVADDPTHHRSDD